MRHFTMRMRVLCPVLTSLCLSGVAALAQPKAGSPGTPAAKTSALPSGVGGTWFRDLDVRQSLNITEDQFLRMNRSFDHLNTRFRDDLAKSSSLSESEQAERLRNLSQTFRGDLDTSFGGILDKKQMERFQQLDLQYRGPGALADADVVKKLDLTEDQQKRLKKLDQEVHRVVEELAEASRTNLAGALKKYNELRIRVQDQVKLILNAEQRTAWTKLTGEAYDFQPPFGRTEK